MASNPGEDQPIVVAGASHHMTVQVRDTYAVCHPQIFSLSPKDPALPFKEVVIMDGAREVIRWQLSDQWTVTIG